MLEHVIKSAITKDVQVFAMAGEQTSFLDALEIATFGNAKHIAMGTSTRKGHREIAACVGFYEFVKMQWGFTGRPESELSGKFTDAVSRRNRLAHGLLVEVLRSDITEPEALTFMQESSALFYEIRVLISIADQLSSASGSIATDGSSLPRFKTTN